MSLTVSRIAPTPNGEIHWGNLMNYALVWQVVRRNGGRLWLRFDDVDQARCKKIYKEQTKHALNFLGLNWDEEAKDQPTRLDHYKDRLKLLPHYVCHCSRQEVYARSGDYHYDGHCRLKKLPFVAEKSAIRFLSSKNPHNDFILWRKENIPAYHLTSVVDDIDMGVNIIVRGEDLRESSEVQKELSSCFSGDPLSKVKFIHHKLLLDETGEKLSKSRHDGDLAKKIDSGLKARDIWSELSKRMSLASVVTSAEDFLKVDTSKVLE